MVVNPNEQQVEMWLKWRGPSRAVAPGVRFTPGERVLVEVSRKFTPERLQGLAYKSGFHMQVCVFWRG